MQSSQNLTPSTPEVKPTTAGTPKKGCTWLSDLLAQPEPAKVNPGQPISPQPDESGASKVNSRIRTLKRKNRRLKATIRELREDLATSEAIVRKFMDRATEERDRAGRYMAVIVEAKDLMYKAHDHAFKSFSEANQALIKLTETQCPAS